MSVDGMRETLLAVLLFRMSEATKLSTHSDRIAGYKSVTSVFWLLVDLIHN